MRLFRSFLIGLLIISLGATIHAAARRVGWEENYRTVAIAVGFQDLVGLGAADEVVGRLARLGITAIALGPGELSLSRIEQLHGLGLEPLLLLTNLHRYDAESLKGYLAEPSQLGPKLILFQAEGRAVYTPEQLERIAQAIEADQALVGLLEFGSQKEGAFLYGRGFRRFVRAHAIEPDELEGMEMEEALARFRRAVRERNIRLLLVHPFDASLSYNLGYLERLTALLRRDGFQLGLPGAPPDFRPARLTLALIFLGPLSLGMLALNRAWGLKLSLNLLLLVLGIAIIIAGVNIAEGPFKLTAAWGTAVLAPVAAYLLLGPGFEQGRDTMGRGIAAVLGFSAIAVLGGLWVGTILSGWEFFLKLEQFRGVKAALILPLLGVFLLHFARHGFSKLKAFLLRRPALGELLLLLCGAGALLLVLLRSDNLPLIPVPGMEESVRGALEGALQARPRFKEFLLGHPLLLLWGAQGGRLRDYGIVVLSLGMIGQVSIINTFAHLHAPLLLSLLRTANGLALGLVAGLIVLRITRWGERLWRQDGP